MPDVGPSRNTADKPDVPKSPKEKEGVAAPSAPKPATTPQGPTIFLNSDEDDVTFSPNAAQENFESENVGNTSKSSEVSSEGKVNPEANVEEDESDNEEENEEEESDEEESVVKESDEEESVVRKSDEEREKKSKVEAEQKKAPQEGQSVVGDAATASPTQLKKAATTQVLDPVPFQFPPMSTWTRTKVCAVQPRASKMKRKQPGEERPEENWSLSSPPVDQLATLKIATKLRRTSVGNRKSAQLDSGARK